MNQTGVASTGSRRQARRKRSHMAGTLAQLRLERGGGADLRVGGLLALGLAVLHLVLRGALGDDARSLEIAGGRERALRGDHRVHAGDVAEGVGHGAARVTNGELFLRAPDPEAVLARLVAAD